VTAIAARELAGLAAQAADATGGETTIPVPGFAEPVAVAAEVERDAGLATLRVHVDGGRPPERVTLVTRVAVGE
jgi:hypothetical protein